MRLPNQGKGGCGHTNLLSFPTCSSWGLGPCSSHQSFTGDEAPIYDTGSQTLAPRRGNGTPLPPCTEKSSNPLPCPHPPAWEGQAWEVGHTLPCGAGVGWLGWWIPFRSHAMVVDAVWGTSESRLQAAQEQPGSSTQAAALSNSGGSKPSSKQARSQVAAGTQPKKQFLLRIDHTGGTVPMRLLFHLVLQYVRIAVKLHRRLIAVSRHHVGKKMPQQGPATGF